MRRRLAALVLPLALVAVACGDDDAGDDRAADGRDTTTTAEARVEPTSFAERGPHPVGQIDLETADGVRMAVFYPAAADLPEDAEPYTYSGEDVLDPAIAAVLPDALAGEVAPADTWVEVPASDDGPFPLVLHSHGFSANSRFGNRHHAAVASWGFVVASVDHPERGLAAVLGAFLGGGSEASSDERLDTEQLLAALDHLSAPDALAGTPLEGIVDVERVAVEGHSAGGSASGTAAFDERVSLWIGQAPGAPLPPEGDLDAYRTEPGGRLDTIALLRDAEPFAAESLIIAAEGDDTIPLSAVERIYEWLGAPKRLAVIAGSGHSVFVDPCVPIRESGGLSAFVEGLGLDPAEVPVVRLGEDGCLPEDTDPAVVWGLIDHLTVAQLRLTFGIEPEVAEASLDPAYLDEAFPGLLLRLDADQG